MAVGDLDGDGDNDVSQCLGRDCGAVVPREAERCPACGGRFRETVDDPKAMLD